MSLITWNIHQSLSFASTTNGHESYQPRPAPHKRSRERKTEREGEREVSGHFFDTAFSLNGFQLCSAKRRGDEGDETSAKIYCIKIYESS